MPSVGPVLPSVKHQALAQQLQPSHEPAWCRSQLHFGVMPRGLQTHSWRCLGICNFQQELGALSTSPGPRFGHPPLPTGEQVEPCGAAAASLFYCRQKAGLVSVTRSRHVSLPKPFPNPKSQGLCRRAAKRDGSTPPGATQTSPSQQGNLQTCPSPSKPGGKNGISANLGMSPQEWHLPADFCSAPLPRAALQAAALCRQAGVGDEAVFSTTIDITGPFSYTVISLFRALNAKW